MGVIDGATAHVFLHGDDAGFALATHDQTC
jgi:hypothetical protein